MTHITRAHHTRDPRRAAISVVAVVATVTAITGFSGTAAAQAVDPAVPVPSVHYAFDQDPRTTGVVADSSGNGHDGTLVDPQNAGFVAGADAGSQALAFTGGAGNSTGPYVTLPAGVIASPDVTVSARVRWGSDSAAWQWMFALGTDTDRYLFATPANNAGLLRSATTTSGAGGEATVTGSAELPADAWQTVTVTLDTSAHLLTTYLDGAEIGRAPTTATATDLVSAGTTGSGYLGRSFYGDPLFHGDYDDFAVYPEALTAAQVGGLVAAVPAPVALARTSFALRTTVGTPPALPATVASTFTDGYDRPVMITWNTVPTSAYARRGTFTVAGTADEQPVTATVTVVLPGQLTVDLGSNTGAFVGGASGSLYGLYGDTLPNANIIAGAGLRTVATKAQDGPQHPGADALEVVEPLADATGGDTYIYMTDIYRGFPYQWPGDTPQAKLDDFAAKIGKQVDQVLTLDPKYQAHIVFVPFNEPEGNMFGTGEWSLDGTSWLDDPTDYYAAWDRMYRLIKGKMPAARIAGPNTSVLFPQVQGFLRHAIAANTMPDVMTWHELSQPGQIRTNVAQYRTWEQQVFAGTRYAGTQLPINLDEYAFNYHTSVPGQMIQWISAIEDTKVDADIAYWNIDGNISDSMVESNRGNGQWWLLNAYSQMTGHTVTVDPPSPNQNYTLQGVATLDPAKKQARILMGGAAGEAHVLVDHVDAASFGTTVHALVQRIDWTGQIGDSASPATVAETDLPVGADGSVSLDFGSELPALTESSAYQVILSPGAHATSPSVPPTTYSATYEAEDAAHTGDGYSKNGPEGTPNDVSKFFTSGAYDVGGLRTGSNVELDFDVTAPATGTYDLSVFANSLNTYPLNAEQGPVNVFLTVDGKAEQEIYLPLGYKFVVWDHADTTVDLTAGHHTITLAARNLAGTKGTKGDEIIDKIDLSLPNPAATSTIYQAENAELAGGATVDDSHDGASGSGTVSVAAGQSVTFWTYAADDAPAALRVETLGGGGSAQVAVNGTSIADITGTRSIPVSLAGGVNAITVTGASGTLLLDDISIAEGDSTLTSTTYQAEDATLAGTATVGDLSLARGGKAVTGIGGAPDNTNTLTFTTVTVDRPGTYAMVVRYSNQEQSPATHYNPDPLARPADISVNGAASRRILFPHSFHQNEFWDMTIPIELKAGPNTIAFSSHEETDFDATTYISDREPELLRSMYAPNIDQITITPMTVAPSIAATIASAAPMGDAGWYRGPATVALALDTGTGTIEYRLDGGAWSPYTGPIAVAGDAKHSVDYRASVDGTVIESSAGSTEVKIDATAPVTKVTVTPPDAHGAAGDPVHVAFSAADATSGVATTEYRLGDGPWTMAADTGLDVAAPGTTTVSFRSTDHAGNVETPQITTVTIDAVETTLTLTPPTVAAGSTVTATGTDFGPGESVAITADDGTVVARAVADEAGRFTVSQAVPAQTQPGVVRLTATGASSHRAAQASLTVTAAPAPAATRISASLNRFIVIRGAAVTSTVRVSAAGSASPTGTVTIYDNGRKAASVQLTAADRGVVRLGVPSRARGLHIITTTFVGATGYSNSRAVPSVLIVF